MTLCRSRSNEPKRHCEAKSYVLVRLSRLVASFYYYSMGPARYQWIYADDEDKKVCRGNGDIFSTIWPYFLKNTARGCVTFFLWKIFLWSKYDNIGTLVCPKHPQVTRVFHKNFKTLKVQGSKSRCQTHNRARIFGLRHNQIWTLGWPKPPETAH